jgi:Fe(3+) dicitrate transport protein
MVIRLEGKPPVGMHWWLEDRRNLDARGRPRVVDVTAGQFRPRLTRRERECGSPCWFRKRLSIAAREIIAAVRREFRGKSLQPVNASALVLALSLLTGPAAAGPVAGAGERAQPAGALAVRGRVTDPTGAPVAGASLSLRREADSFLASGRSASDGRFSLEGLAGDFEVAATAAGYSVARAQVHLPVDASVELEIRLQPGVFSEAITVVGTRLAGSAETLERLPGSVDVLDQHQLETSRVMTVNEALHKATGVNVRDEEGLALRPNIGIRGQNPTRSSKTLLLEDGVFITYAPYGDNATYYHPPIERFEAIEVVKGSGQIAYGPVTVGAVVNYLTPAPPVKPSANLRLAAGNRDYWNAQGAAGGTWGPAAVLAEYMHKQGEGARDNLHSRVDDLNLKAVFTLGARHSLILKGNHYDEGSQITYSGLTLAEWDEDPRQNPFLNDAFDGARTGASARHTWVLGSTSVLTTQLYGSRFSRDWWRQSSHSGQRPNDRADPACGGMDNLLTACGNEGRLRDFDHFGIEPRLRASLPLFGLPSEAEVGVRAHFEVQERRQENGSAPLARSGVLVENNRRENRAFAAFVQDRLLLGDVTLSAGVRLEAIGYERTNRLAGGGAGASGSTSLSQWLPGIGLNWAPSAALNLFGGVHRGFAPPRTEDVISQTGGIVELDAERSWNYELGLRTLPARGLRLDLTLFRNDYENQIVAASLAGGVGATLTNGGETLHEGLELGARLDSGTLTGSRHNVFLRGALTWLPVARFEGTRFSSVPGQGSVSVSGNRLPYAPETLLTLGLGYSHPRGLTAQLEAVHVGEQLTDDLNSVVASADGQRGLLPAHTICNIAVSWDFSRLTLYVTAKNVFDELYLVDRSRGMIPGQPRLVQAGLATRF